MTISHLTAQDVRETDIAALLASRICHDLISPIGAIGNGVELLALTGGGPEAEMALIGDSVRNANARIRFFRLAFGLAFPGQTIAGPEVAAILADVTRGGRHAIGWTSPRDVPRPEAKLACLLVLCAETALPHGGRIDVAAGPSGWTIAASGQRLALDEPLWSAFRQAGAALGEAPRWPAPVTAAQVHFALVPGELAALGRRLAIAATETTLTLGF